ncbi:MAG: murein biosynthesis integral membrane protein MurJ [Phycisphaerales bacterium]|nr:murein biosynthesis integral membrane protein MurJ [Phycisphaerales bacterium]
MATFETNARTVSLLTFVSRITGLAREAAMSRVFGTTAVMDVFAFAFQIPNLFRRLFGEGALSVAFLPAYASADQSNPEMARRLAWLVLSRAMILMAAITVVGEVILLFLPSGDADALMGNRLLMLMLPYMPLVCLVALIGAVLQAHHRFGPTAAAPIILNLGVAAAALASGSMFPFESGDRVHIMYVGAAVLGAGVLQLAWSVHALLGIRRAKPDPAARDAARAAARAPFHAVLRRTFPMALGLGVLQINTFLDGLIASYPTWVGPTIFGVAYPLPEGSMATLSYAQRLYEFPLGVFGIAVATAVFPQLARLAGDLPAFKETLTRGLRLSLFIGLPASLGLALLSVPSAAVVFQGDAFSAADSTRVGSVLAAYAFAIWAYSINQLLTRAFYARGETMVPVRIAVSMVSLNLLLNATLIWTPLGVMGLAVSTAICSVLQCVWMYVLLRRRLGEIATREVWLAWGRTAVASVVCLLSAVAGMMLARSVALPALGLNEQEWMGAAVTLALAIPAGAGALVLVARALKMPELRWALGRA